MPIARRMWLLFEPMHAVTYFAPESVDAFKRAGLKGFWMGYFAGRAAPMGAVPSAVVEATFYNFAPCMVSRAIPDAWGFATPEHVLEARLTGVGRALEKMLGPSASAQTVRQAAELGRAAIEGLNVAGRPLAAANLALPIPNDPLHALWHAATVLREHRGDGHISALVAAELGGCEAHVSFAATGSVPRPILQTSRGWTDDEWAEAEASLRGRELLDSKGHLTESGRDWRRQIEDLTDQLATQPWQQLGEERTDTLRHLVQPMIHAIRGSGIIPSLNPIGLPR